MQNANDHREDLLREGETQANHDLLRDYEQIKFELASLIRMAGSYAHGEEDELRRQCRALQTKLAEDRFYVAVVGQSSRGKSTLINAVIGMDRLPTGIVPITSAITTVGYGSKELVKIYTRGWSYGLDIPLEELPDYITEQGNPGNEENIDVAEVQLPAEILQHGFYLVDTPGFGSAIFENTLTTRSFLPKADAFVFVTSFDTPFSAEELDFSREAQSRGRNVFVVINKADLVSAGQRDEVMEFLRSRLTSDFQQNRLSFFPVSAREALTGKLDHDPGKLTNSGLPVLESALIDFLTTEKESQLLVQTCRALEELLKEHSDPDLALILDKVHAVSRKIGVHSSNGHSSIRRDSASGRALQIRPCSICSAILDAVFRTLSSYQYQLWRGVDEQEAHAKRKGFCAMHSWQYERIASPQGVSSAYPRLLSSFAERLNEWSQSEVPLEELRRSLRELQCTSIDCKLCQVAKNAEQRAVKDAIARCSSEPSHAQQWTICLPHLVRMLDDISDVEIARHLTQAMSSALQTVAGNMQRYGLKHEGLRRELASDEEAHAGEVGIRLVVGHANVLPGKP